METFQGSAFLCVFKVLPHRPGGGKAIGTVCLQYLRCYQTTGQQMSQLDTFQRNPSVSEGFISLPERTEGASGDDAVKRRMEPVWPVQETHFVLLHDAFHMWAWQDFTGILGTWQI